MNQMKFDLLDDDDYQQMLKWEEAEQKYKKNKNHPLIKKQNIANQNDDRLIQIQNISNNQMLQAQHQRPGTSLQILQYMKGNQQNPLKNNYMDFPFQAPPDIPKLPPPIMQKMPPPPPFINYTEQQKIPPPPQQPKKIYIQEYQIKPNLLQKEQPILQQKSQTIEICSNCNKSKEKNHQCDGEFGFVLCPFCGDSIVRNFMNDHQQEDCIPYVESQFKNIEKVEECQICFEDMSKNTQTLKCKHTFHKKCIDQWKTKSKECPICRSI